MSEKKKYLVWSRAYVGNSLVFWREGKAGYTTDIDKAHKFTYEKAIETIGSSDHRLISWEYLQMISTRQIHGDHLDWDYVGKEVMDA